MQAADPSIPPANGKCLLLALPAELRNEIYEHALSHNEGILVLAKDEGFKYRVDGHNDDNPHTSNPNPLAYVCRQLRAEMRGMLFRLNDMVFRTQGQLLEPTNGDQVVAVAKRFLRTLPRTLYPQPSKVIIYPKTKFPGYMTFDVIEFRQAIFDLTQISKFCRENPQINVLMRFQYNNYWMIYSLAWIKVHYFFHRELRSEKPVFEVPDWMQTLCKPMYIIDQIMDGNERPLNLRMTLAQDLLHGQDNMDGYFKLGHAIWGASKDTERVKLDEVVAIAKTMFEEGV